MRTPPRSNWFLDDLDDYINPWASEKCTNVKNLPVEAIRTTTSYPYGFLTETLSQYVNHHQPGLQAGIQGHQPSRGFGTWDTTTCLSSIPTPPTVKISVSETIAFWEAHPEIVDSALSGGPHDLLSQDSGSIPKIGMA